MKRAIVTSAAVHLLLAALWLAAAFLAGRPPSPPQVPPSIDLVMGGGAQATGAGQTGEGQERPREAAPPAPQAPPGAQTAPDPSPPNPRPPEPNADRTATTEPVSPGPETAEPTDPAGALPQRQPDPAREPAVAPPRTAEAPPAAAPAPPPDPDPPAVRLGDGQAGPSAELPDPDDRRFRAAKAEDGNLPPDYPAAAGARREQGVVRLRMHVDDGGHVMRVEVLKSSGSRTLDKAARDRLAGWRFSPALRDDVPVGDTVDLDINFKLE